MLSWTSDGITYEADRRHADIVIQELGLKEGKVVTSPSCKEDVDRILADVGSPLPPAEAIQYRALAARLNYLALGRADVQFATKEVAKYMACLLYTSPSPRDRG